MQTKIIEMSSFLDQFISENDIINQTLKSCQRAIDECEKEEIELELPPLNGMDKSKLHFKFEECSMLFKRIGRHQPCIRTTVNILFDEDYEGESLGVGYYSLDIDENGEVFDDWLILRRPDDLGG